MTPGPTSADHLYRRLRDTLRWHWEAGKGGRKREICNSDNPIGRAMVGHLNPLRAHRITILGHQELDFISRLETGERDRLVADMIAQARNILVLADGLELPGYLRGPADAHDFPIWTSPTPSHELVREVQYFVDGHLTIPLILHGVLLDVFGMGVLVTGDPGVGKSELALELISRGHRLIADDAPEFRRTAPDTVTGTCPETIRGFLEVRGLGVLDISAMYGDTAIKPRQNLRLIVHLQRMSVEQIHAIDRLRGSRSTDTILEVDVPKVTLPVAPGRDLAVLLETAVRNQHLIARGHDASEVFTRVQSAAMARKQV
ncbi:MAG: HPr(Ser) kinase/phosphatase [Gammaproteobacteria bacterium]